MPARTKLSVLSLSGDLWRGSLYIFRQVRPPGRPVPGGLLPVLTAVLFITLVDARKGTLLFIALFPLVNSLPYFFKLYEPLPMAPAALVLFLFFFGGWLGSLLLRNRELYRDAPLFRPLGLFAALVVLSGLITFWRYANFVPFRSSHIYELVTNAHGVTAGGALMSVVFCSLNYLTGIAFLLIAYNAIRSGRDIGPVLVAVLIGVYASVSFGLIQHFGHLGLGNNPISVRQGLVNGTLKDALSFGTYLAMVIPLLLGIVLAHRGAFRFLAFAILVPAACILLFTGSKSGLLGLPVSLGVFALLNVRAVKPVLRARPRSWKRISWSSRAVVLMILAFVIGGVIFREALFEKATSSKASARLKGMFLQETMDGVFRGRTDVLWKLALPMIRDYPLTGLGTGSFIIEVSNYAKARGVHKPTPESAENYFLQVGTEMGFIGMALVLWVFWLLVKQMKRSVSASPRPPGTGGSSRARSRGSSPISSRSRSTPSSAVTRSSISSGCSSRSSWPPGGSRPPPRVRRPLGARRDPGSGDCSSPDSPSTEASSSGIRPMRSPLRAGPGNSGSARISGSPGRRRRRTARPSGGPAAAQARPSASISP